MSPLGTIYTRNATDRVEYIGQSEYLDSTPHELYGGISFKLIALLFW